MAREEVSGALNKSPGELSPRGAARFFSLMVRTESSCFWLVLFRQSKPLRVASVMTKALDFLYDFYDPK